MGKLLKTSWSDDPYALFDSHTSQRFLRLTMKLTVEEVMTTAVVSIRDDAPIDDAFSLMLRHHISGLPVVDDDNVLVGVISELDLLRLLNDLHTELLLTYSAPRPQG